MTIADPSPDRSIADDSSATGIPAPGDGPPATATPTASAWRRSARRFARQRLPMVGLTFIVLCAVVAIFAPLIAPYEPDLQQTSIRLQPPNADHWFGTDDLGRDLFSRVVHATRLSLLAPAIAVGIALLIGLPAGLAAGYHGGWRDWLLSRLADALMCLPPLVLAIAIIAALGPSMVNAMLAIGIVYSPRIFRVVRGSTLATRNETYVEALRSLGCPHRRVIWQHVLPNVASPVIVQVSLMMGFSLLAEASLSFLGLGVQPPDASWGVLVRRGFRNIYDAPYFIVIPGIAITLVVLAFAVIGDGVRDSFGRESVRT